MHRFFTLTAMILLFTMGALATPCLAGEDSPVDGWPQFRGVHRDGVSSDSAAIPPWSEKKPELVWKRPLGPGFSEVAVSGGRIFTMYSAPDGEEMAEFAAAFDPATGKEIWRVPVGKELVDEFGNGPRSTPSVAGDTAYFLGSYGHMMALSAADGKKLWDVDFKERFGSSPPRWGFSTSPLVAGDLLLVETGGGEGKAFAALDRKTGENKWITQDGQAGYNSPLPIMLDGVSQFIFVGTSGEIVSLNHDGEPIWSHTYGKGVSPIAMPVFVEPDMLFVSSSEQGGGLLIRISKKDGKAVAEELWRSPKMKNNWSSSVVWDGHIYGFDNATLRCVSIESGEPLWQKRGFGKGSLIRSGKWLLILTDQGKLLQVEATPTGWKEAGAIQAIEGKSWTAPTLTGDRIYLRNLTEMACYAVSP